MNITTATKTVVTRTHTAAMSADDVKACALSAVKKNAKLTDDQIASSKVEIAADGEVTVEIVEVANEALPAETAPGAPAAEVQPAAEHAAPALRTGFLAH